MDSRLRGNDMRGTTDIMSRKVSGMSIYRTKSGQDKKVALATPLFSAVVHLETYSLRLLHLKLYVLRLYNFLAEFRKEQVTTFDELIS